MKTPAATFFAHDPDWVAKHLIGALLLVDGVGGLIVETESYDPTDPASNSFELRRTKKNAAMFGPPGRAHVYSTYGMHWMMNFVCKGASGVLIRALEPTVGVDKMKRRRGTDMEKLLCSGPGRLTQALKITGALDHVSVFKAPFTLKVPARLADIASGTRIGISKGIDLQRRFGLRGSPFLSKKIPD
ncbi:MAG TPA: DNA-3-methyladenine glycosylase [Rhizomicrobium sp.]|nr:DNA-3-methyladenine glycosylase [Rhizomicrobium sp.]